MYRSKTVCPQHWPADKSVLCLARERERERERQTDRQTDSERERFTFSEMVKILLMYSFSVETLFPLCWPA